MAAEALIEAEKCFHCGLPVPPGPQISASVLGATRSMCCLGCCAVAEMLEAQGLADWYLRREQAPGVQAAALDDLFAESALLDEPALQEDFLTLGVDDLAEASLLVEGLNCAACVWVIERHLGSVAGVHEARVNLATHRAHLKWDPERTSLRDLVLGLAQIGFKARPDQPGEAAQIEERENRSALIRLAVAGFGAMNVMTYSVALYAGDLEGMASGYEGLMRWAGLLVSTPVLAIAARPFFSAALRDLRLARPGMDVPVALAIGGAYLVSAYATLTGEGEVYFDSACMFTFFLSVGRYVEMKIRHRATSLTRDMADAAPLIARRIRGGEEEVVHAHSLTIGDRFRVRPGETIPADGLVREGSGSVEEALLTGEPWPRSVSSGSKVIAGSINIESPLSVEATRIGQETTLAQVVSLIDRVQSERPAVAYIADRVATVFVTCVLGIALVNLAVWGMLDPDRAIWTTLAVLVATCPCALSLATPAALAAATHGFARAGLLITNGRLMEGLTRADRFVFDKTGTLTRGEARVARVLPASGYGIEEALEIARRLECDSEHPVARAFRTDSPVLRIVEEAERAEYRSIPGSGIEGKLDGTQYRIGRPEWALQGPDARLQRPDDAHVWILLAAGEELVAWFGLKDSIREEAVPALDELSTRGIALELLSGDPSASGRVLARELGLDVVHLGATPEEKVMRVRELQAAGERVVVVGDGVNDAPLLKAGDISIAMGSGCDLSRLGADAVLINDDLRLLPLAVDGARRARRVVTQNFLWAIGYNAVVLPLAVTGQLAPWLAAIGMSTSSLVVVLNALRLRRLEVGR